MTGRTPSANPKTRHYSLGLLLCFLLFLFAVSAKTALYHPKDISLASTKVLKNNAVHVVAAAPAVQASAVLIFPLLLAAAPAPIFWRREAPRPARIAAKASIPRLAVRPPPSI